MTIDFHVGKWQCFPNGCLISDGKQQIKLEPKAMDLLVVLASAEGQLVTRDDIFANVWKNQIIADHVLYNLIANLRKILEDDPQKPTYIITVPKKGYRLGQPTQPLQQPAIQVKKPRWHTLMNIAAGILLFVIMAYWINQPLDQNPTPTEKTAIPSSIAVLPFDIYDADTNLSYFADGLSEEIIHQLTAIPELAVISRTSSFAFRGKSMDIQSIANKLNSQFVLEGSIRKSGEQLRLTIQLIKAKTATHLWSKVFDITETDVFKLQQDISLSIVNSMLPEYGDIPVGKLRVHPRHGEAYRHFLRGKAMAAKATVEHIQQAIAEWQTAIELQPDYALAHVSIAFNTMVLYQHRVIEAEEARDIAQRAIATALQQDPFLALAHTAQGLLHVNYGEFAAAETAFIRALNLDPTLPLAHHNYGYLLWLQSKHQQALGHFQRALATNPMSAISNFAVADSLFVTGQLDAALKQYKHCVALLPDYPACQLGIANFYRFTGQPQNVQQHMLKAQQQLAKDNTYWLTAKTVDAMWQGNPVQASRIRDTMAIFEDSHYLDLQLKTLMNVQIGKSQQWSLKLAYSAKKWPQNKSITLVLALNYYFAGDYPASIKLYESIPFKDIELYEKFSVAAWGVSHVANMADCYQQSNNQPKLQKMLLSLRQQTDKFKTDNYVIPGLMLLQAKMDLLSGNAAQAKTKLSNLDKLDWPLEWMQQVDPIFGSIR
ncbi:winged helix-turn-helix domain-containing protein [uncultured Paraglaciecola sp.]|uniref:winged helix-turn-helix domain-containing protein n=1 Tax=uncultured Paraglaciecola sp. TaxID=1765024 RepID=UPI002601D65A|nr:winged helix-turn-helix domain-containing protein [uncultured Paraglaciecola sp.]